MREIKFRAWNETTKTMTTPFVWVNESNLFSTVMTSSPTHELMQFTGLKDSDGIDIYEGDIVEDEEHYYSVISWSDKYSCWYASDTGGVDDLCWPIRVIGNIHQNPELLK